MGKHCDKVAIVTGAGRGTGRGTAEKLSTEGATVVVTDLDQQSAENTAKELGGGATGLGVDVTSKDSVTEMVAAVTEKFGRIDVLVNNAGWDKVGPFVGSDQRTGLVVERLAQALLYTTDDKAEVADAFPAKRRPVFQGR